MAQPRFLYVQGHESIPAWPGQDEPLRGRPAPDGSWIAWRLVGRNNHELARSAIVYPDVTECAAAAEALRSCCERLDLRIGPLAGSGQWIWRCLCDGEYVAVASRSYSRQRECAYSEEQFLAALPQARTSEVRVIDLARRRNAAGQLAQPFDGGREPGHPETPGRHLDPPPGPSQLAPPPVTALTVPGAACPL